MAGYSFDVLCGTRATENEVPPVTDDDVVFLTGWQGRRPVRLGLDEKLFSRHILCIGGTGSGKTNTIDCIFDQIKRRMGPRDVAIVFDTKGDYMRSFYEPDKGDLLMGCSSKYRDISQRWNLFRDILIDGNEDSPISYNVSEIVRGLFRRQESDVQPFFVNAARDILGAFLTASVRESKTDDKLRQELLNNRTILNFVRRAKAPDYARIAESYRDLNAAEVFLGRSENTQGLGVLAELRAMVDSTFVGIFGEAGDFSMRDFVRNKGGRTLFLEYDVVIGDTLGPLYSLLMDLALKEALGREKSDGNVYVIVDEFSLLPDMQHMGDAVNFGRSMGLKIVAGVQSVSQLFEMYGENGGRSISAGFQTVLAFRPNDSVTCDFVRDYFGQNLLLDIYQGGGRNESEKRIGYTVEGWELSGLRVGQAVVQLSGRPPCIVQFDEFKKA